MRQAELAWKFVIFGALGMFLFVGPVLGADPIKSLRAGAFAADITPTKFPVSSNGSMTDRMVTRAHDPLHARCLVLDDGTTTIAFAVCDCCMIPREIFDAAKELATRKTGIPVNRLLM